VLSCCCCAGRKRGCCGARTSSLFYVFGVLCFATAIAATFVYGSAFSKGAVEIISSLSDVTTLLSDATQSLPPLSSEAGLAAGAANELYTQALALGAPQADLDAITALQTGCIQLEEGAASLYSALNNTVNEMKRDFPSGGVGSETPWGTVPLTAEGWTTGLTVSSGRSALFTLTFGLGTAVLMAALLSLLLVAPFKMSACLFRTALPCTLLAAVLVMLVTGVMYAAALGGSDFCADNTASILRVLNATTSGEGAAVTAASVSYYSACAASPGLSPAGVFASAVQANNTVASAQAQTQAFAAIVASTPALASLLPYIDAVAVHVNSASATTASITAAVSCAPVSAVWASLVITVCSATVEKGINRTYLAFAAASAALFVVLAASAALCCSHPGDEMTRADKDAAYAQGVEDLRAARVQSMGAGAKYGKVPSGVAPRMGDARGDAPGVQQRGSAASYSAQNWA
jgi:hypothetical protein